MRELSPKTVAIIAVLVVAVGLGGVFLGRSLVDQADSDADGGESAAASETTTSAAPSTETTAAADPAGGDGAGGAGGADGDGDVGLGAAPAVVDEPAPGELRPVESATPPGYAYQNPEDARINTGTVPPPVLPVRVSMSSTTNLRDGDPVNIRVEALEGSQIFAFDARICRADAVVRNDFDFIPVFNPQCTDIGVSPNSDGVIRVLADASYQVAEGSIRVGVGTATFETDAGELASLTCGPSNPCKLVLKLQVPYGFGFQEFPLGFA